MAKELKTYDNLEKALAHAKLLGFNYIAVDKNYMQYTNIIFMYNKIPKLNSKFIGQWKPSQGDETNYRRLALYTGDISWIQSLRPR